MTPLPDLPDVAFGFPPASLRERLRLLFEEWTTRRRAPSLLERIVATLTFDGVPGLSVAGARGGSPGAVRQLVFTSDPADLTVHVTDAGPGAFALHGVVLLAGDDDRPLHLQLFDAFSGAVEAETDSDPVGTFRLTGVSPGSYVLSAIDDAREITFGPIDLPGAA